jgi:hypothetical protein
VSTSRTKFYVNNEQAQLQTFTVPLTRDRNGHINSFSFKSKKYSFKLDELGNVVSFTITEIPLFLNLGRDTSICIPFHFELNAGNPGASYLWSTGATIQIINVTTSGKYWVKVSLNGKQVSDTVTISSRSDVTPQFSYDYQLGLGNFSFLNQTTFCSAEPYLPSYHWQFDDEGESSLENPTFHFKTTGWKRVKLTVTVIGVTEQSYPIEKEVLVSLIHPYVRPEHQLEFSRFRRLPFLDAANNLILEGVPTNYEYYQLLGINGQVFSRGRVMPRTNIILTEIMPAGIFFLRLVGRNGQTVLKLIKK